MSVTEKRMMAELLNEARMTNDLLEKIYSKLNYLADDMVALKTTVNEISEIVKK